MQFGLWLEGQVMTVYRGTGPEGIKKLRPSEEGVHGPGIYFYDNVKDATAFSEREGGIIVAQVDTSDPEIKVVEKPVYMVGSNIVLRQQKIIIVPDASKVQVIDTISNDQT